MEYLLTTPGWFLAVVYTHGPILEKEFIHSRCKKKKKKIKKNNFSLKKNIKNKKKKKKNSRIIFCHWKKLLNSMIVSSGQKYTLQILTMKYLKKYLKKAFKKAISGVKISYRR